MQCIIMENTLIKLTHFDFGPVVQEISFQDISYLELYQPLNRQRRPFVRFW